MILKKSLLTGIALSMSLAPLPAAAGSDFLPGLIIGGIIGAGIAQGNQGRGGRRSGIASTQEGKDVQSALNYFGFPAGMVDGQLGRKSRNAISNYQGHMGFQSSGQLTDFEKNFLLTSHQRALLGGPVISQVRSTSYNGNQALLYHFRDELNGTATAATQPEPTKPAPPIEPAAGGLPSFFGSGAGPSLASHCNSVSLVTNSNGGFVTQANMVDPEFTLSEQFCMARTYAIARGEDLLTSVQGVTPDQVVAQCEGFGPAMRDYVTALSLETSDQVMQNVSGFILSTGMAPADLAGSARICLSVGYRTDNLDVAIGSALLLTVLGEKPYGELLGHHLGLGFGVNKRPDLAIAWYDTALISLANGAIPVFGAGLPERAALIQAAAYALNSGAALVPNNGGAANGKANALPVFSASQ